MNSALRKLEKKAKRQQKAIELTAWLILSAVAFIGVNIILKASQIFFSLQGIH